ncbi:BTAD domain-containing putative transcriptional regulator [Vitiosangium sp. GDMCC 1.1324]|uniref:BTAD domain-containing putative transcriptional regulator n=1 Tax=Vitiosangium sp. (strain GDMCC 1.1324) TaxID=2138576 RepID=UPI00130EFD52|nr:BTAD domain-containing putative transcriptional regulator [Vitiosangium sp. GDMCC 1.1324]
MTSPQSAPRHLERKAAALVTYLAIEGPTERSRLAGLLWPDTPDKAARGNLRQLLRRLRLALGEDSLSGEDPVWLRENLLIDTRLFREGFEACEYSRLSTFHGELLAGFTYDDCAELDEWLRIQRTRFHYFQCRAAEAEALRLEQEGQLGSALDAARRQLHLQPTSEQAWRTVMRLLLLRGDRSSALQAYRDCQALLHRELGIDPSTETRALAQGIERPSDAERTRLRPAPEEIPLLVLSPPVLVGRDHEWEVLEEAWAESRPTYVLGQAGIGKTRLVSDFSSAQGSWLLVAARPADPPTPYATSARVARAVLGLAPERPLEPWVRQEIARLVPELGPSAPPLPSCPEEKARLAEALARLIRACCEDMAALVLDDAHRCDPASFELHLRVQDLLLETRPEEDALRLFTCFRMGELSSGFEERLREHREAGLATWLEVEPLAPGSVGELLAGMSVPGLETSAPEMARYTGGNPLFIIETARSLVAAGDFNGSFPAVPPPSDRVTWIVEQRLKRLSPDALRLARTVALAGSDFSLELAAYVLGLPADQLAAPWKELEEARILRGATFTQGVLRRIVIESLPHPVREAVLQRISACSRRG